MTAILFFFTLAVMEAPEFPFERPPISAGVRFDRKVGPDSRIVAHRRSWKLPEGWLAVRRAEPRMEFRWSDLRVNEYDGQGHFRRQLYARSSAESPFPSMNFLDVTAGKHYVGIAWIDQRSSLQIGLWPIPNGVNDDRFMLARQTARTREDGPAVGLEPSHDVKARFSGDLLEGTLELCIDYPNVRHVWRAKPSKPPEIHPWIWEKVSEGPPGPRRPTSKPADPSWMEPD